MLLTDEEQLDISGKRANNLEERISNLERLLNRWATPIHTFINTFNEKTKLYEVYDEMGTLCGTLKFKGRLGKYGTGAPIYDDWQLDKDCPYIQPEMVQLVNYLKELGAL